MKVYGVWGGNPKGTPEDLTRCIESVNSGWHSKQCDRKRGYGPNGKYCKQHDPEAIAKRKQIKEAIYQNKRKATNQIYEDAAVGRWLRQNKPKQYADIKEGRCQK